MGFFVVHLLLLMHSMIVTSLIINLHISTIVPSNGFSVNLRTVSRDFHSTAEPGPSPSLIIRHQ